MNLRRLSLLLALSPVLGEAQASRPVEAPATEVDQLKQQNALLLKRLMMVSRERDALMKQIAALLPPEPMSANEAEAR